jgi:hypothetical protein
MVLPLEITSLTICFYVFRAISSGASTNIESLLHNGDGNFTNSEHMARYCIHDTS